MWLRSTPGSFALKIASPSALIVARRHLTRSPACTSASNAALPASAFHQEHTATNNIAPATTTGRPSKENPSALELRSICFYQLLLLPNNSALQFISVQDL